MKDHIFRQTGSRMKLDVVDACFIGVADRSHGKIQAGEGLMSEMLMECDEHGVALPVPEETVLYRICIDGQDSSPLTEVMTLEAHKALINLLLRDREEQRRK